MLKLIEGSYASFFPKEIDAMHRNRAETFSDRLGWEVVVKDGYERDVFDDANPLYLVSVDPDTEEYRGSLRMLPTTGPNMLRDVFPQLLDGDYVESATIWEVSRICAAALPASRNGAGAASTTVSERTHIGNWRSRSRRRADPSRFCIRRQDFPRSEGRRMQSRNHWHASADRGRHVLRGPFRHRRGPAQSVSRRNWDRSVRFSLRAPKRSRLPEAAHPPGRSYSHSVGPLNWLKVESVSRRNRQVVKSA